MKTNSLKINQREISIPDIGVSSWLNQNFVTEEFTVTLDVLVTDEKTAPVYIRYDHILLNEFKDIRELMNRNIHLSGLNNNKYLSTIEIDGQKCEPLWLTFFLSANEVATITGGGVIRKLNTGEEVRLDFSAKALVDATEVIEYEPDGETHHRRNRMIQLLETIASPSEQLRCRKAAPPFVHVPIELLHQWESVYEIGLKRFANEYTPAEIDEFTKIQELIDAIYQKYKMDMPDVPAILEEQLWNKLISESNRVKEIIKKAPA
jgi:hypothetical protein